MKLLGSIPVLACKHIEQTLEFYQQSLQFVVLNQRKDELGLAWVHLQSGDVVIMLERIDTALPATNQSQLRIYMYTDAVKELHHFLKANHYQPGELITTAYQTLEFEITDPEGHHITLGQSLG